MSHPHVGILGGTFDPVHIGHLRTALELVELLKLDRMLLVPGGIPPHRKAPATTPEHRLQMVELALRGDGLIEADGRECAKQSVSYTIETLRELRQELGPKPTLSLCVGADAFLGMPTWRCWQELPELCHIVVIARPGWHLPEDLGALEQWRHRFVYQNDTLVGSSQGKVLFVSLTPMAVSASEIRAIIASGQSPRYLIPDAVWHYIQQHRLYRAE